MSVGIVGGGALGIAVAAALQRAGVDVRVVTARPGSAELLCAGVEIVAGGAARIERFAARCDPGMLADCAVVLVLVKAYDTAAAAAALAGVLPREAVVVTLQNGLGNAEILRTALSASAIVVGATAIGAYRPAPGRVVIAGVGETVLAGEAGAVRLAAGLLRAAGLPVAVAGDPGRVVWEKAIVSAAINPIAAILGVANGALLAAGEVRELQAKVVTEGAAVAVALGIDANAAHLSSRVREVCRATAANRCSMLQDLHAGRRTEIDAITGAIVEHGHRTGIGVAANEALLLLVRALEALRTSAHERAELAAHEAPHAVSDVVA
jgi:2-dehydropantoate 2-reductase